MSEETREIVANTSCDLCTDAKYRERFAPRPSRGGVVHPTLLSQFDPTEAQKAGWVLHLTFHGRHDQTRVYHMVLRLGSVAHVRGRSVFFLDDIVSADEEVFIPRAGERYVLGTIAKPEMGATHVPSGIRINEFLVFGDAQGNVLDLVMIPVAHIIAEYSRVNP